MKRSKTASISIIPNLPSWSEARMNPKSVARGFAHSLYRQVDYISDNYSNIKDSLYLSTLNPIVEPYRNWVSTAGDITPSGTEFTAAEIVEDAESYDIVGYIDMQPSGESISVPMVTDTREYLYSDATAYYVEDTVQISGVADAIPGVLDSSGNPITYSGQAEIASIVDDVGYIMLDSITSGSPVGFTIDIGTDFVHGEMSGEEFIISPFNDPLLLTSQVRYTISQANQKILIDSFVHEGSIFVVNVYDTFGGTDYTATSTAELNYSIDKYDEKYDFNGDGIIDEDDYNTLQSHVGKKSSDYTISEWETNYDKYDLNKDGKITTQDLIIMDNYMNSAAREGTIITMKQAGVFDIRYQFTEDGGTSYVYNSGTGAAYLDTKIYEGISPTKSESWIAASHSEDLDAMLYLDVDQHRITAVKYDTDISDLIVDTFDIILPIESKYDRAISMDVYVNKLYVLVSGESSYYFVVYDLDGDLNETYSIRYIHSTKRSDEVIPRDKEGLVNPIGFGVLDKEVIAVFDKTAAGELAVKLVRGVFDYAFKDNVLPEDVPGIFLREKYDSVTIGDHSLDQVYFHIWNKFDEFAFESGMERLPGENNIKLRARLWDYIYNYPDPSREKIEKEIDREFRVWN